MARNYPHERLQLINEISMLDLDQYQIVINEINYTCQLTFAVKARNYSHKRLLLIR